MLSARKSVECANSCFYMQTVLRDRARKEHLGFVFRIWIFDYRWISAESFALIFDLYVIFSYSYGFYHP